MNKDRHRVRDGESNEKRNRKRNRNRGSDRYRDRERDEARIRKWNGDATRNWGKKLR